MLSYRHAFHAGNHADVLKHAIVVQLLEQLSQKDKPFWLNKRRFYRRIRML